MRIPLWPGVRLSVWATQNPEAVQVRMPYARPSAPIRRVLSMRGWMLLLIRYDWRNKEYQPSEADAPRQVVARVRVECDRLEAAVRANPTNPDFDGGYLAAVRHVRAVASGRSSWEGDGR